MIKSKNKSYEEQITQFITHIQEADAIVVGAASGMSAAAGYRHYYEHDKDFVTYLGDFEKKYGYRNSFDGFYYRYSSSEERWAFLAKYLCMILDAKTGQPYYDLFEILKNKNYYVLTTNQDTQFNRLFPEEKISAIQGDWRYFQCSRRCHDELYNSEKILHELSEAMILILEFRQTRSLIVRNVVPRWNRGCVPGSSWKEKSIMRNMKNSTLF